MPSPLCSPSGGTGLKTVLGSVVGLLGGAGKGVRGWSRGGTHHVVAAGPPGKAGAGAKPSKQLLPSPRLGVFGDWKVPSCPAGRLFLSLWVLVTHSKSSLGDRRDRFHMGEDSLRMLGRRQKTVGSAPTCSSDVQWILLHPPALGWGDRSFGMRPPAQPSLSEGDALPKPSLKGAANWEPGASHLPPSALRVMLATPASPATPAPLGSINPSPNTR